MFALWNHRWRYRTVCTQGWHFHLMIIREYPGKEDAVARELADELIRKGLIVEGNNEGQIRLTDKGVMESKRIECIQRNRLEDWDNYQLYSKEMFKAR